MRTAIIGMGIIGKVHAEILLDKKIEIVAISDIDDKKANDFPLIPFYLDYKKMILEVKPDIVHICTPHYLHAEMVIFALQHNVNVLCEKPLCINQEDIARIIEVEQNSVAQLGVCFQNRYLPRNLFVKSFLQGKKIKNAMATLAWNRGEEYYTSSKWRGTKYGEGGGVLINQAIHTIDILEWFLGEPEYVAAQVSNLTLSDVIEVEDTATLICSGKTNFVFFATNGSNNYLPIEIIIQTETDLIRLYEDKVEINNKVVMCENVNAYYGKPCYGMGHAPLIDDFYNSIKEKKGFMIDGIEGAKAVKLVLAAYKSKGKKIKIQDV